MSKSWFYLSVISSLAILTSSCGDGDKQAAAPSPSPSVATSPAPAAATPSTTAAVPNPSTSTAPGAAATATPGKPGATAAGKPVSADLAAGLIPPTDPENWSRTVSKGRTDPFAAIDLHPIEVATIKDPTQQAQPQASSSTVKKSTLTTPIATQSNSKTNRKIASSSSIIKSGVTKPLPKIQVPAKIAKAATVSETSKVTSVATKSPQGDNISIAAIPRSGINRPLPKIAVAITDLNPKPAIGAKKTEAAKVATKLPSIVKPAQATISKKPQTTKVATKSPPATASKKPEITKGSAPTQIATKPEAVAPKPLQAMAIEISGMIDVAGKTQVIVKLPNESFSRYVEVGEKISNGKVLVKRVEGQNSLSPTVILQEFGVEVSRKIGEKSTPSAPESSPKPQ